jgi:hypothetical protein
MLCYNWQVGFCRNWLQLAFTERLGQLRHCCTGQSCVTLARAQTHDAASSAQPAVYNQQ